jgi:hypothetical protein
MIINKNKFFRLLFVTMSLALFATIRPMQKEQMIIELLNQFHNDFPLGLILRTLLSPEKPSPQPFFSYELFKSIPNKLIELCYNHPKLCIGGTAITASLILFRKSGYWPVTKKDIKNLRKEAQKKFGQEDTSFRNTTGKHTKTRTLEMVSTIQESNKSINHLHMPIRLIKTKIDKFPEHIMNIAQQAAMLSFKQQEALLNFAHKEQDRLLNETETSIIHILNNNKDDLSKQVLEVESLKNRIAAQIDITLKKVSEECTLASDSFSALSSSLHEQQKSSIHSAFTINYGETNDILSSLLNELTTLESSLSSNDHYEEIDKLLQEQEKLLEL